MTLPLDETARLLADMHGLVTCTRAQGYACITARREHGASSVEISQPYIAILLEGRKQVSLVNQSLDMGPGDVFLVTRRCRIDVVNQPDPDSGRYLAALVPFCTEALDAARLLWNEPLPAAGNALAALKLVDHASALGRWRQALQDALYSDARLALTTLAINLARQGHGSLLLPPQPSLGERIRDHVAADPGRDWQSRDVEALVGMSGATLRRHLAAEETHLRDVVAEARLNQAMQLLYTTQLPLKTVAARVGYRSLGSFNKRFHARFGLAPADIGLPTTA